MHASKMSNDIDCHKGSACALSSTHLKPHSIGRLQGVPESVAQAMDYHRT